MQRRCVGVGAAQVCRAVDRKRRRVSQTQQENLRDTVQLDQQVSGIADFILNLRTSRTKSQEINAVETSNIVHFNDALYAAL